MAAELAVARAQASATDALIAHLKLQIAKLNRERFGPHSERSQRLLDQLELQLEELEASASEDDLAAEMAAARTTSIASFERQRPARKPFPEHLPRERVVVPAPCSCPACGGTQLSKVGEDVTETLEVIPRQWKAIQTVREKFSCRDCEAITQPPAPFHVVPRGWAGPSFLAMLLFEKYGQHQPLTRGNAVAIVVLPPPGTDFQQALQDLVCAMARAAAIEHCSAAHPDSSSMPERGEAVASETPASGQRVPRDPTAPSD